MMEKQCQDDLYYTFCTYATHTWTYSLDLSEEKTWGYGSGLSKERKNYSGGLFQLLCDGVVACVMISPPRSFFLCKQTELMSPSGLEDKDKGTHVSLTVELSPLITSHPLFATIKAAQCPHPDYTWRWKKREAIWNIHTYQFWSETNQRLLC